MIPSVEFRGLSKSFGGVLANAEISFKVQKGSIHAIVGENGAGKSTAMKLLYGLYQCDEGEIHINGELWGGKQKPWSSPADAIHCGIGMVHQHFMLGDPYTVLDNILLGVETSHPFWKYVPLAFRPIDRISIRKKLQKIMAQNGFQVDLDEKVSELPVGVQQRIEILKLLYRDAQILILDEPTAVLTPQETAELFLQLKKLASEGKTILIITHKLKEVMNLADHVTVFRMGRVVGEREIGQTSPEDLASLMVGRKVNLYPDAPPPKPVLGESVLELKELSLETHRRLQNLNLNLRGGEIVGISGVEGNGQSELLQVVTHPQEHLHQMKGAIRLFGQDSRAYSAEAVKKLGVGIIPEDRHRDALLLERPVSENFVLGIHRRKPFYKNGFISTRALEEASWDALESYDIRPRSIHVHSGRLSGGNQQKLVIAREFKYSPRLLIAAQPTRGVDVGAIEFIHKKILKARAEGAAVLLISSELDEILSLSDRILVMFEGKFVAEFARGEVNERALGLQMGGAEH